MVGAGPAKCMSIPTLHNNTDQEALLALKAAITYDPQSLLARNWTTNTSFCNWAGITCSNRRERVTTLNISGMGLVGTIPPQLGNLSFLWLIDIQENRFHGYIPPELANLRRIQYLSFSSNNLTGTIPDAFFNMSSLVGIRVTYNMLHGNLPRNICDHLPNLVSLLLSGNSFSGQIPPDIWKCRRLQKISLSLNYFVGEIPEEVGYLPMLRILYLGGNNLTGMYDNVMYSMVENFAAATEQYLPISDSPICNSPIPESLFNISTLVLIDLDANRLSGFLPTSIGNLRNLQFLTLENNFLTNDPSSPEIDFLTSLANCKALTKLRLEYNLFSGFLPQSIGNLTSNLTDLLMGYNNLVGNLPGELGNLTGLITLSLTSNNLSGAIPPSVAGMGNLQLLDLSTNKLNGSIPADLCYARSLSELNLQQNQLSGVLPDCIGLLTSLRLLLLDVNALSSSIPLSLWGLKDLIMLTLTSNSLNGSLPPQVGDMTALTQLNLSGNYLSGDIPSTLGKLQSLQTLELSNNSFHGAIPESFGNFKSLVSLDLSYNNLSGKIPKSLEEVVSLRDFKSILLRFVLPLAASLVLVAAITLLVKYGLDGVVSTKIDVYSFGIMLMEIFTRRKPTDEMFDGGISLASWVKASLPSSTMTIVDSNMLNGDNRNSVNEKKCLISVMEMALQCAHELPEERLNMIEISARLRKIRTYGMDGVVSTKIDVYSFGIMLMETFTRKKPTDAMFDGGISLASWVKVSLPSSIMSIVDSNMLIGENRNSVNEEKCLISIMELALQCAHELPEERINVIEI
ncbi:hypothetical protein Tsubulata_050239 [Turnera subulata]|uniref:non-specific serine/threonine protein kinase n=1 Tax=Turnera subulata TaxID=218843 RepID=A0A9Q0GIW8_9ROSI|nr:hypothetical protein Tsubulata_050239 [Turnera subulata]